MPERQHALLQRSPVCLPERLRIMQLIEPLNADARILLASLFTAQYCLNLLHALLTVCFSLLPVVISVLIGCVLNRKGSGGTIPTAKPKPDTTYRCRRRSSVNAAVITSTSTTRPQRSNAAVRGLKCNRPQTAGANPRARGLSITMGAKATAGSDFSSAGGVNRTSRCHCVSVTSPRQEVSIVFLVVTVCLSVTLTVGGSHRVSIWPLSLCVCLWVALAVTVRLCVRLALCPSFTVSVCAGVHGISRSTHTSSPLHW